MTILSICCPVFNGGRFFEKNLKHLIRNLKYFKYDYEILISNNNSNDNTHEIICKIVKKYKNINIKYFQQNSNIGLYPNANFLINKAQGKFVTIHCHDDKILNKFYEEATDYLLENSKCALVYCNSQFVDLKKNFFHRKETGGNMGTGKNQLIRFINTVKCLETAPVLGVIRRSILKKTSLFKNFVGADHVLLNKISMFGYFHNTKKFDLLRYESNEKYILNEHVSKVGQNKFFIMTNLIKENIKIIFFCKNVNFYKKIKIIFLVIHIQKKLFLNDIKFILKIFKVKWKFL
jgi:glycosyltransferase involved in cell wall biosynthesis